MRVTEALLVESTAGNSSFSRQIPGLQLAVDSTSLGSFKECPRKYFYQNVLGWQSAHQSVHLRFGILLHGARERYEHSRSQGQDHESALRLVTRWCLAETWDSKLRRPWISGHRSKTRLGLLRTVVWYLDEFGRDDPMSTVQLANGKPAVELSFTFPMGLEADSGEEFSMCGHLDRIVEHGGAHYISDIKSTEHSIDASWFSKFSPDNQFSLYSIAGQVAFGFKLSGLIVDGIQIGVNFSRCQRGFIPRSQSQLEEWFAESHWWVEQMQSCAQALRWPQNDKSCGLYGGCQFRGVCGKPEGVREGLLVAGYRRAVWDPLQRRGDV